MEGGSRGTASRFSTSGNSLALRMVRLTKNSVTCSDLATSPAVTVQRPPASAAMPTRRRVPSGCVCLAPGSVARTRSLVAEFLAVCCDGGW